MTSPKEPQSFILPSRKLKFLGPQNLSSSRLEKPCEETTPSVCTVSSWDQPWNLLHWGGGGSCLGTFVAATEAYAVRTISTFSTILPPNIKNGLEFFKLAGNQETGISWGSGTPNQFDPITCFRLRVCKSPLML